MKASLTSRRSSRHSWWGPLILAPLIALGLAACSSGQAVLPDWDSEAATARMTYTPPQAVTASEAEPAAEFAPGATAEPSGEATAEGPESGAPVRGVVYRAPEPLLWAHPYWATRWLYAGPAARYRAGIPYGYSPYRDAFTALHYPWYGWSPRYEGVYPHPWNAAYQPGFRSWVYTPPFGDADGGDFLFANPGPGIPASGRGYSSAFSRAGGGTRGAANASARRSALSRSILRLEDFAAPQTLRPVNPGAAHRTPHASGVQSYPASGAGLRRPGAPSTTRSGTSTSGYAPGTRPRR